MGFSLWFPSDPISLRIRYEVGLYCFALYQVGIGHWVEGLGITMVLDYWRLWGITMCPWRSLHFRKCQLFRDIYLASISVV